MTDARCCRCEKLLLRIDPEGSALIFRRCPRCGAMSEITLLDGRVNVASGPPRLASAVERHVDVTT